MDATASTRPRATEQNASPRESWTPSLFETVRTAVGKGLGKLPALIDGACDAGETGDSGARLLWRASAESVKLTEDIQTATVLQVTDLMDGMFELLSLVEGVRALHQGDARGTLAGMACDLLNQVVTDLDRPGGFSAARTGSPSVVEVPSRLQDGPHADAVDRAQDAAAVLGELDRMYPKEGFGCIQTALWSGIYTLETDEGETPSKNDCEIALNGFMKVAMVLMKFDHVADRLVGAASYLLGVAILKAREAVEVAQ